MNIFFSEPGYLTAKIRTVLILCALLCYVVILSISVFCASREIKGNLSDVMISAARISRAIINDDIHRYRNIEEMLAGIPWEDGEEIRGYLQGKISFLEPGDCAYILNARGIVVSATREYEDMIGLDFSRLEYVQAGVQVSGVHQSLINNNPVVTLQYVMPGGRRLMMEKDLTAIPEKLEQLSVAGLIGKAFLFILAGDGTVIFHPEKELVASRYNLGLNIHAVSQPDRKGIFIFECNGRKFLGYRETLNLPFNWTFYAALPYSAYQDYVIRKLSLQSVLLAVVLLVMLGFIQFLLERRFSRPINRLANSLSRLEPDETRELSLPDPDRNTVELLQITDAVNRLLENVRIANVRMIEKEHELKSILDHSPAMIHLKDSEGRYRLTNRRYRDFFGLNNVDIAGKTPQDIFPEEVAQQQCANDRKVIEKKTPVQYDEDVSNEDGLHVFLSVKFPLFDSAGNAVGVCGISTDISDRKRMEDMLQKSEKRYRNIFNMVPASIWEEDVSEVLSDIDELKSQGVEDIGAYLDEHPEFVQDAVRKVRILDVNRETLRMYGAKTKDELLGSFEKIFAPESLEVFKKIIVAMSQGDAEFCSEAVNQTLQQEKIDIFLSIALSAEEIAERKILLTIMDITKRKQAEQALLREKELLSVTLQSIGDGVITTDIDGRIVIMSRMAQEITGWSEEDARGRPLTDVYHKIDSLSRNRRDVPIDKILETGQIGDLSRNSILVARNGAEKIVIDSGAPIRDVDGEVVGLVLVFRDVTNQVKLEEEAWKVEKLESLGVLAGGIAHDFNNLLTAIQGNISLAKMFSGSDSRALVRLKAAEKAAQRARDLTQQLMTFARGGAPVTETVSLVDIIRDSVDFVLRGSKTKCEVDIPEDLWPVEVDPGQMNQVFNNLLINADQSMPEGGVVRVVGTNVRVEPDDDLPLDPGKYVKISIEDQGIGISKKYLHKIFDPYFTTKQKGSGLGLASCHSIIKRHNGFLTLESQVSKGTIFYIYLPASVRKTAGANDSGAELIKGQGRVLVMDDEDMVRELAGETLQLLGYEPGFARDGKEAVDLYRESMEVDKKFSAVIMDLTIPGGMGGYEAVGEILKVDPDARVIVSSGYAQAPIMSDYRKYGFMGVLAKPYRAEKMARVLAEVCSD